MNHNLSVDQRELRKNEKKLRKEKRKENWNMNRIGELESIILQLETKMKIDKMNKEKKEKSKNITEEELLNMKYENYHRDDNNHKIPNNRKTRIHRKRVIQKLNEHIMSEYMNQQMEIRIQMINHIKDQIEKEK